MSNQPKSTETDVSMESISLPVKRTDGDTIEERLTANAYHNILPARYLQKDEDGNIIEDKDKIFERIAKNVALADAVFDDDSTPTGRPVDVKPNASTNQRRNLVDEVFGSDVELDDDETEVDLTPENINAFAYDTIVPRLSNDLRSHVAQRKDEFTEIMENLSFIPNSPTIMNAGGELQQLSACFVDSPADDITDIHHTAAEAAEVFQSGGGMGYAFWKLRPYGDSVGSSGGIASGPITFMRTYDQMCETIAQGGTRRGAQMGVMRISHPDVIQFIHAKNKDVSLAHTLRLNDPDDYTHSSFIDALEEARELIEVDEDGNKKVPKHLRNAVEGHLSNFNISVGVTDEFMEALENGEEFTFTNPRTEEPHIANEYTEELYEQFGLGEYVTPGEELSIPAEVVWERMIQGAHENGEPGVVYLERMNKEHSFDVSEHPEHQILATNPCVAEGTLVNTPNGYKRVEDIELGEEVSTVIGSEPVDEIEVHEDKEVKRVRFSDGSFVDVTDDHIFHLLDGKEVVDTVRLKDVEEGDTVRLNPAQIQVDGTEDDYYTHLQKGVLIGDGCYTEQTLDVHNVVKIAGNEDETVYNENLKDLFQNQKFNADDTHADGKSRNMVMSDGGAVVESLGLNPAPAHNKDFDVTELDSKKAVLGILDGLLASDGNVNLNSTHPQIRWDTSSYELAQSIRQALLLIGVHGRISISSKADRGGVIDDRKISANYDKHTVNISGSSAGKYARMSDVGELHPAKGQALREMQTDWMTTGNTWKAQIESIEQIDDTQTVYDLYCSESDTWITSGYVSRGCGEQPLEEYEACNLGHINLSTLASKKGVSWAAWFADNKENYPELADKIDSGADLGAEDYVEPMDDFLNEVGLDMDEFNSRIETGTRFLENVVTMSDFPVEKITQKVRELRKIGLGIMGLAQLYVQLGLQYGDAPANAAAEVIMKHINHESKQVSHTLAEERGSFADWDESKYADPVAYRDWFEHHTGEDADEWEDGYPIRNHNTTTIAPTGTTSMLGNTTGGCEPMFNIAYYKNVSEDVQGDEMLVEFDDYFIRVLEENNLDVEAAKQEAQELMANNEFEPSRLESVPDAVTDLFVVSGQLSGKEHAAVQCACQKGVDSAISKTCNFPQSATKDDMEEVYRYIYEHGGKGVTVYRDGTRSKQVLTTRADNTEFSDDGEFTEFLTEQINDGTVSVEQVIDTLQSEFDVRATESPAGQLGVSEYRKRPDALVGINQRINTGYGTLYVWISEDVDGNMFEVFASIGKAGGYTQSFTEALCRMISMALRYGVPPQRVVKHLSGIQSPKVAWENQEQVASVADGIAMAMDRYLEYDGVVGLISEMRDNDSDIADQLLGSEPPENLDVEAQRQGVDEAIEGEVQLGESVDLGGPESNGEAPAQTDSTQDLIAQGESPECPDCERMTLYMSEGCKTCESCGWSEC